MVSNDSLFEYVVIILFILDIIMVAFVLYPPDWCDFLIVSENETSIWDNNTNELTLKKEISTKYHEYDNITVKINFYNNSKCFKSINITNSTTNHKLFINTVVELPEKPKITEFKIIDFNSKNTI